MKKLGLVGGLGPESAVEITIPQFNTTAIHIERIVEWMFDGMLGVADE